MGWSTGSRSIRGPVGGDHATHQETPKTQNHMAQNPMFVGAVLARACLCTQPPTGLKNTDQPRVPRVCFDDEGEARHEEEKPSACWLLLNVGRCRAQARAPFQRVSYLPVCAMLLCALGGDDEDLSTMERKEGAESFRRNGRGRRSQQCTGLTYT